MHSAPKKHTQKKGSDDLIPQEKGSLLPRSIETFVENEYTVHYLLVRYLTNQDSVPRFKEPGVPYRAYLALAARPARPA